jgi:cytidylate kinase
MASRRSRRRASPDEGLVVALDGPGSSGKSSVGAAAALELGYRFMDTGLLYRALTWLALQRGVSDEDGEGLVALVPEVALIPDEQGRLAHVSVDEVDVTADVHTEEVDRRVSAYSRVAELRAALLDRQRAIAGGGRIIVAGRDIGTVVLPDADLKLFLNASAEERARRRAQERGIDPGGEEGQAILVELRRRDELDSTRAVAPLRAADDARVLVTDGNEFADTVRLVVAEIRSAERREPPARHTASRPRLESGIPWWMRALAAVVRLGLRGFTRFRVEGDLDAIPRTGPVIIAANHASNLDPVLVGAVFTPRLGRRLHWLAKKEIFDWPIVGWMARNGGIHPVDRSTADIEAFRTARRILDEGQILFVFPEGTRSRDGALQQARDGLAVLALRTGAPIVPIGIVDSDRRWPKGQKLPRPGGRVVFRVGQPFTLADASGSDRGREAKARATRELMGQIAALLPARQRGYYAGAPAPTASPGAAPTSPAAGPAATD